MKNNSYDDIINLPHPVSKNHPQMPLRDRAAQFAPFAALTGHDAAIKETARLTDERLELSEEVIAQLNEKINIIRNNIGIEQNVSPEACLNLPALFIGCHGSFRTVVANQDLQFGHTVGVFQHGTCNVDIFPFEEKQLVVDTLLPELEPVKQMPSPDILGGFGIT